jgi:DNA repair exonuclease SbcCD ATPase subunit
MASLDSEISTLNESIQSIQRSVDKAIEKEKENTQSEIDEIKSQMESKKSDYATLKEKVDKIKVKDSELSSELEKEKRQYIIIQTEIKGVQKDVDLYDSGKCPTCKTYFDSEHFVSLRSTLIEKKQSLESHKLEIENNIKAVKERQQKLQTISEVATKSFNDITYFLKNCKAQIEKLQSKQQRENGKSSENVQEFKSTIKELQAKKNLSSDNISGCKDKELYYKELGKIFSEDGVKKSIISGIIKPINFFISENIKKMGLHFEVSLDETFTAEIKHLGNNIEHDTLSTGEQKKINVAILIAYLKLIRTKKHINVLFLDEVFSSIDLEGISDILSLLKSFSNEYNINIFVVHHALLNHENFDRIISIHKEIFSSIEELNFENININGEEYTYQV